MSLEAVSKVPEGKDEASEVKEALVKIEASFIANQETTEVAEMGEGALHFPASVIAPERSSVLELDFAAAAMRADQLDAARGETFPEPLRIVSPVADEPGRPIARPTATSPWHLHGAQGFFREADFGGRGAKESTSQRYTRAVCHHHPLCTLATFGFTHTEPPFLAGAKLPSMNTSSQLSRPWASSSERNSRQMLSQISSSSQSRNRRQQVLAEGYRSGRSRHRAPLRSTHRMPSKTSRSSARGRPKLPGGGRSGWIFSHWDSLSNVRSCIPSFPHQSAQSYQHTMWHARN